MPTFGQGKLVSAVDLEIFARIFFAKLRIFARINPPRNGNITLLLTDTGKSCLSHEF